MKPTYIHCLNCWKPVERKQYFQHRFDYSCSYCSFYWSITYANNIPQFAFSRPNTKGVHEFYSHLVPEDILAIFKELPL